MAAPGLSNILRLLACVSGAGMQIYSMQVLTLLVQHLCVTLMYIITR